MACEMVLTIFIPEWLTFENFSLFYELGGVSWFHGNSNHSGKYINYKIYSAQLLKLNSISRNET